MRVVAIVLLGAVTVVVGLAAHERFRFHDAYFESSDGVWADGTVLFKGRDFESVLWYFEAYKLKRNRPDVTLVRVTPDSRWMFLWKREERGDPMWKVPVGPSHGRRPYIGSGLTEKEMSEVSRRAKEAFEVWRQK